jgi:mRNA interferase MazF
VIRQGEIWLLEEPSTKARPALVLVRNEAIDLLSSITVAPLTRTIRGIPSEVSLGRADGVAFDCVANFDSVKSVPREFLTRRLGQLDSGRWHEVCYAMRASIAC